MDGLNHKKRTVTESEWYRGQTGQSYLDVLSGRSILNPSYCLDESISCHKIFILDDTILMISVCHPIFHFVNLFILGFKKAFFIFVSVFMGRTWDSTIHPIVWWDISFWVWDGMFERDKVK